MNQTADQATKHAFQLQKLTATEYAAQLNGETRAWVAEEEGRGAGMLVENQDFWAEREILNGLQLARYLAASTISDMYKEAHGFRPRGIDFGSMTLAEMDAEIEQLTEKAPKKQSRAK